MHNLYIWADVWLLFKLLKLLVYTNLKVNQANNLDFLKRNLKGYNLIYLFNQMMKKNEEHLKCINTLLPVLTIVLKTQIHQDGKLFY